MGHVTHVSTSSELRIASSLSLARSKIFLETRFYIRDALSSLFNMDPLKIPISADPGKPPILPSEMGFISISHCKDSFIIGWHEEKIGVDIERSDRDFNYQNLAKKYFIEDNTRKDNFNKYTILREWSAIEAAIKYDRGALSKDIKEWKYQKEKENIWHKSKKIKLSLMQFPFLDWTISIAYKNKTINNLPKIICSNL